jgi:rRNA maturation endonuclease Nob1
MKQGYERFKTFCGGCDRAIVERGKKCHVCGKKMPKVKQNKKKAILMELNS